jgi:hypothetical protein
MIAERHKQFLLGQAHANDVRHSGRALYDHLLGTHDFLRMWGNDDDVCHAGLFHSIYGTRHFRHRAWPLDDRATIRDLIGKTAEFLVYLFCVTDRPRALLTAVNSLRDHHSGDLLVLWPETLRDLREIEAANLLDQGGRRWLNALRACEISDGAARAIDQYLEMKDGIARGDGGEWRAAGR